VPMTKDHFITTFLYSCFTTARNLRILLVKRCESLL
jgi:hypothetical protein